MKRIACSFIFLLAAFLVAPAQTATESAKNLLGQVVCCADCWAEADRKTVDYGTAEDVEKAAQCIADGDPTLLAVANNDRGWILYQLRQGKYKRPGKNWLDFVGKQIEVTGSTGTKKNQHFIKVDTLTVLKDRPVEKVIPAANVVGTEVELALKDLSGVKQRLSAYKGRVVILNFWATYCWPCRIEMPDLASIQNEYASLGVQVIGAAADTLKDKAKVRKFIKDSKVNFPIWLGVTAADVRRFGLRLLLPGTVIIDRDGKVVAQLKGMIKVGQLKKHLDKLVVKGETGAKGK